MVILYTEVQKKGPVRVVVKVFSLQFEVSKSSFLWFLTVQFETFEHKCRYFEQFQESLAVIL